MVRGFSISTCGRQRGARAQALPVQSKAGAEDFEHQLRTALLAPTHSTKEVPTFAAYADEFKKTYVLANNKPSERSMKASILKHHLLPVFGEMQLDAIKMHAIVVSRTLGRALHSGCPPSRIAWLEVRCSSARGVRRHPTNPLVRAILGHDR
jgi:hypothetical protein